MRSELDNLGALPDKWLWVKLNAIGELLRGVSYNKDEASANPKQDFLPVLRAHNIGREINLNQLVYVPHQRVSSEQRILRDDIVIAMSSGSKDLVGKAAQSNRNYDAGFGAFCGLVRLSREINQKFIGYYFQSPHYRERIAASSSGVNINNLRREHIELLHVPFPPLSEQKRIVKKLEELLTELDSGVTELRKAHIQLKRYRQAVLKAAVTGKLTKEWRNVHKEALESPPELHARLITERFEKWEADQLAKGNDKTARKDNWRKRYRPPAEPQSERPEELPKEWDWVALGQVTWSVKDGPHFSPKYVTDGVPFITGGNVRSSGVDFSAAKNISRELHEELSKRCKPAKNDILYTKGGTTGIARVNTYEIDFNVWVHVAVLKLIDSVDPFYVQHALNSPDCYRQAQVFTHGVGNQDLGLTRMVNITFGLPSLVEQKVISQEVQRLMSLADAVERSLEECILWTERLRQSILKRAFEGKLVPQSPTDESAELLLERIGLERAKRQADNQSEAKSNRKRFANKDTKRSQGVAA